MYGLENLLYKDVKPGGYAWLLILNFMKLMFLFMPELLVEPTEQCASFGKYGNVIHVHTLAISSFSLFPQPFTHSLSL